MSARNGGISDACRGLLTDVDAMERGTNQGSYSSIIYHLPIQLVHPIFLTDLYYITSTEDLRDNYTRMSITNEWLLL